MPQITLPDGSIKAYDAPVTALHVAQDIGPRLAQQALGVKVDGELRDLSTLLDHDCQLQIITPRSRKGDLDDDALFLLRHSTAHVMAEAIERLIPGVELVYGPPVSSGFYYDMAIPDSHPLSSDDFEAIEREMAAIVKEDRPFTRYEMGVEKGMSKLQGEGSKYKTDNAQRAVETGADQLSWYVTGQPGENWEDLCRGPHVPSTGRLGAFKVMSLASSYWHGDETSDRLTRVYGVAFPDQKSLNKHLELLEAAKQRDHRILGKKLDLFHIDDAVGQGLILWTPRGAIIRRQLQDFISGELRRQGYQEVFTPHIGKLGLYKTSGHFPYYQDSQYPPLVMRESLGAMAEEGCSCGDLANRMREGEIEGYLLKPMNCPHHIKIFASRPHSYRELPVRLAEFGTVYRWEQSGELNGLTRVRGFTQDDAHLFCTEDQVAQELANCLSLVKIIFNALGMSDYRVRVGLREKDTSKYIGDEAQWAKAERACIEAAQSLGAPFTQEPGEAAFYGPKIDFVIKDVLGREWQLGTVQVDYNLPERFDLSYIGADNNAHRPVMIHRAPFGSMERFVGVLIEHFAGAFPMWLAPEQIRVLPISEKSNEYARSIEKSLSEASFRSSMDDSNQRIQAKIKAATEWKIPYLLVVGPRDAESGSVSVRAQGVRENLGAMPLEAFLEAAKQEVKTQGAETIKAWFAAACG